VIDLLERLRERAWRLTPQRRVVAEVLRGDHVHLTADEIRARARELLPEISLATVYNTLNELVAMGEVLELTAANGPKRYDPNVLERHQHLVCIHCGTLLDVHASGEDRLTLRARERHGFKILDAEIVFRGVCPPCATTH